MLFFSPVKNVAFFHRILKDMKCLCVFIRFVSILADINSGLNSSPDLLFPPSCLHGHGICSKCTNNNCYPPPFHIPELLHHHLHHHHVVTSARISLTLSCHHSLSFIASRRSQGYTPYPHRAAVCRFQLV